MAAKCEKLGCEREARNTVRYTDLVHTDLDADYPVVLCEEHTNEARTFEKTDDLGLKKWLMT
jgi:hypothetical protein